MRLPVGWLREYVDFDDDAAGLAERLTFSGVEVEGVETIGAACEGVVVGETLAVERHPNADKLTVCRVRYGDEEATVVCGAPNVRAGGKYPFAPLGTTLPGGLTIERRKLRGVESCGMLCAADELGLSKDHEGLMALDEVWAPGTPIAEVLGPPETVLDLEITPNRPDCLSVLGLAREVAALYGTKRRLPAIELPVSGEPVEELARVEVEDAEGCPRYVVRVLRGLRIGLSPDWMRRRLEAAGVRAINNVVDITNYVMLECGQPLHAFDRRLLKEAVVRVRRAGPGEKMATLDEVDRPLAPDMLVIADSAGPVALAGVMGGAGTEIRSSTTEVLLESACFKPALIRSTSKRLGLSTESSYRFERGVDPEAVEWCGRRAAALMVEHAGGVCAPGAIDRYPGRREPKAVRCRYHRLNALLGLEVGAESIRGVFGALELPCRVDGDESCEVTIPSFRPDLTREADLIEEFARIHGLDKVPAPAPLAQLVPGADDRPSREVEILREALVGLGLREVMHYSLTSDHLLDAFDATDAERRIRLPNPISAEQTTLRGSLIPQLAETLGRNRARQVERCALFEIGRVFRRASDGRSVEDDRVAVGLLGPVARTGLDVRAPLTEEEALLSLKGIWEALVERLRCPDAEVALTDAPWSEEGRALALKVSGATVGHMGLLREGLRRAWRLHDPVALMEARIEPLTRHLDRVPAAVVPPSFPSVSRDAALVVPADMTHARVMETLRRVAPPELERVALFDVFTGGSLGQGMKSMAFAFTYRSPNRTLTDEEANAYHNHVKQGLKRELNVDVREN